MCVQFHFTRQTPPIMFDSTSTSSDTAAIRAAAAATSPPLSDSPPSSPPPNSLVTTPPPLTSPRPGRSCHRNRRDPTLAPSTTTAPTPVDVNTKTSTAIKTINHPHSNNTGAGTHAPHDAPPAPYHSDSTAAITAHTTPPAAEAAVAKAVRRRHRPAWNSFHPADPEDARRVDGVMNCEAVGWGMDRMNKAREFLGVFFPPHFVDLCYRG